MTTSRFALITLATVFWLQQSHAAPIGVDDGISQLPEIETQTPKTAAPTLPTSPSSEQPIHLTDEDLKNNARLADQILGHALQIQDWATIERILSFYKDIPQYDPLMILYMQGALDRVQGRHKSAIANYRHMFKQAPELHNVEFDLAVMLFEDKQSRESQQILTGIVDNPEVTDTIKQYAEHYLKVIENNNRIHNTVEIGYKYNDNVNNASDGKILYLWGMEFLKNADSLPQSDEALTYNVQINQDFNLKENHYLGYELQSYGDYYSELEDWRESNFSLKLPYKYQTNRSWFNLTPQFYQQWLEGNRYRSMQGIGVDTGHWVSPRWQSLLNYVWLEKNYSLLGLELYDGDLHVLSFTNAYVYKPDLILVTTLSTQNDKLNSKDESSSKYGIGLGTIKSFDWGNIRLNAHYNYRKFDDYNLWLKVDEKNVIRKDYETQLNLNFTLNKYKIFNFIPKLNYQYLDIDSNIESLYSRKNHQVTLSFERIF